MKRVLVDESVCMGCHLCEVYCQLQHSHAKDPVKAFKKEYPRQLPRLRIENRKPVSFSLRCQHCAEPACIYACLTGALSRNPDTGAVVVDEEKCSGCWTCVIACPFGSIRPDTLRHKSVKCDLCLGAETPACVLHCPNEALVFEDTTNREDKISRIEAPALKQ